MSGEKQKELYETRWLARYDELKEYMAKHGDSIPASHSGPLGKWVDTQRKFYIQLARGKRSSMTDERIRKLEAIGFQWPKYHITFRKRHTTMCNLWEERLRELKEFKVKHGHCNVLTSTGKLGTWIKTQRYQYWLLKKGKKSSMTHDRIHKLESLGFQWSAKEAHREPIDAISVSPKAVDQPKETQINARTIDHDNRTNISNSSFPRQCKKASLSRKRSSQRTSLRQEEKAVKSNCDKKLRGRRLRKRVKVVLDYDYSESGEEKCKRTVVKYGVFI
mmetsp:Transcript_2743/g.4279  ORF Transcript_2743/g.4279 Transcript_2743/m.4279 type:complete len:276 (+) Transcript_2743:119-946(+)